MEYEYDTMARFYRMNGKNVMVKYAITHVVVGLGSFVIQTVVEILLQR
jgi:hypothetical protein